MTPLPPLGLGNTSTHLKQPSLEHVGLKVDPVAQPAFAASSGRDRAGPEHVCTALKPIKELHTGTAAASSCVPLQPSPPTTKARRARPEHSREHF